MLKLGSDMDCFLDMLNRAESNFSVHIDNGNELWVVEVPVNTHTSVFFYFNHVTGAYERLETGEPSWDFL